MQLIDLSDGALTPLEHRILAATLQCVSRWGVGKTTLDDIARAAACSRATVYRTFPGGKDVILLATSRHEIDSALRAVGDACRSADSLDEMLTLALWTGVRQIRDHAALQYLLEHEPGVVLPWLSFDGLDPLLEIVTEFLGPLAARFVAPAQAVELVEALCRLVIAYAFEDSIGSPIEVTDRERAGHLVRTYLLPGIVPGFVADPPADRPLQLSGALLSTNQPV